MRVCLIIPNYNHTKYLDECIQSALNQTYKEIEINVVDDGSNDQESVGNLVRKYQLSDNRIKYIALKNNTGKWNSLNTCISETNCDLITTLDADDTCPRDRIERQVAVFQSVPGTLHVLSCFHHCWSDAEVTEKTSLLQNGPLSIVGHEDVRNMVLYGRSQPGINHYFTGDIETAGASAMFVKQLWDLGLRFNPPRMGLRTLLSEDSDFNFRVTSLLGRTAILNEKVYCYRRNTSTNEETY